MRRFRPLRQDRTFILIIIIKNCYYCGTVRATLIFYSVGILHICILCVRRRLFGLFPICVGTLNKLLLPVVLFLPEVSKYSFLMMIFPCEGVVAG